MDIDPQIVKRAKEGEVDALEKLIKKIRSPLVSYLYWRLGNLTEAEDLCQDLLIKIYSKLPELKEEDSFLPWALALASETCDPFLKNEEPWTPDAIEILNQHLVESPGLEKELHRIYQDYEEQYEIKDHIEFCFTVMAKSLFPKEQNIFLLKELFFLSDKDIGEITEKSLEEVKSQNKGSFETLAESFWDRCSLVRKGASCTQCQDLGKWLEGEKTLQKQQDSLPFGISKTASQGLENRLELVLEVSPDHSPSRKFHQALMDILRRALGKKGMENQPNYRD